MVFPRFLFEGEDGKGDGAEDGDADGEERFEEDEVSIWSDSGG